MASDLRFYFVAGAGFEPATSGLARGEAACYGVARRRTDHLGVVRNTLSYEDSQYPTGTDKRGLYLDTKWTLIESRRRQACGKWPRRRRPVARLPTVKPARDPSVTCQENDQSLAGFSNVASSFACVQTTVTRATARDASEAARIPGSRRDDLDRPCGLRAGWPQPVS